MGFLIQTTLNANNSPEYENILNIPEINYQVRLNSNMF